MKLLLRLSALIMPAAGLMYSQSWEVGATAGYRFLHDVHVTAGSVTGSAGFESGAAVGAVLGNQIGEWVGGEARYTYQTGDLRVSSGSVSARAGAQSHAIHYDILLHATRKEAAIRPFIAAGAGVMLFRGTGAEPSFQPLSNLVVLSHTNEAQPLISFGAGVKFRMSRHAMIRFDFRDYATPVPSSLLAVRPGSRISGWLHDFVFLAGISSVFGTQ